MGTRNSLAFKNQFDLLRKGLMNRFSYGNMVGVVGSIFGVVFCVIGFISRYIFRLLGNDQRGFKSLRDIREREVDFGGGNEREEESDLSLDACCSVSSTNKYEFFSLKDINGFVEEAKALSFTVQELYLGTNESAFISQTPESNTKSSSQEAEDFVGQEEELSQKSKALTPNLIPGIDIDINGCLEEPKALSFTAQEPFLGSEESAIPDNNKIVETREQDDDQAEDFVTQEQELVEKPKTFDQKLFSENDINGDLDESKALIFAIPDDIETREHDDQAEDFSRQEPYDISINGDSNEPKALIFKFPDINGYSYEPKAPIFTVPDIIKIVENREQDEDQAEYFARQDHIDNEPKALSFNFPDINIVETQEQDDEEIIESKPDMAEAKSMADHFPSEQSNSAPNCIDECSITYEFDQHSTESEDEYIELEPKELDKEEKPKSDFEWDHEDVIEQLKWELRSARTGGLPTIMEEETTSDSESSPPARSSGEGCHVTFTRHLHKADLSVKFGYKERMEELKKVYKIYAERMRKLDILNTQTMHALGFLQLKDQSNSKPSQKHKKTILPRKAQKVDDEQALKYAEKLQNDFELVYVGQLCLSWEMLSWQHRKLRDHLLLLQKDQNDVAQRRHYNLVASEFQLFQVLLSRFVEDESFQGPRVHHYAKTRCVVRTLMQVPPLRDDCSKDKRYDVVEEGSESLVFGEGLDRVIVEAMFAFWQFVRKENINYEKRVSQVSEAGDSKLLVDVKREFHKKDKKVKDIQRSGNCVVKKFQKNQQEVGSQHALMLAQVELRLVSRVLSMSRLTRDQLIWCQQKLNQITFSNRKLHMETSFLLFPC